MEENTTNEIEEVIVETFTNVEDILDWKTETEELDTNLPEVSEPIVLTSVWDNTLIRMRISHKHYKKWDDYSLSAKELKAIPKKKYIIL